MRWLMVRQTHHERAGGRERLFPFVPSLPKDSSPDEWHDKLTANGRVGGNRLEGANGISGEDGFFRLS